MDKITKNPTAVELVARVNDLIAASNALAGQGFVVSATAPANTAVLWVNTSNRTLNYFDGSKWDTVVGTYG